MASKRTSNSPAMPVLDEPSIAGLRVRALCVHLVSQHPDHNESAVARSLGLKQPQVHKIISGERSGAASTTVEKIIRKTGLDANFFYAARVEVSKWKEWVRARPDPSPPPGFVEFQTMFAGALSPEPSADELAWLAAMPYPGMAGDYLNILKIARRSKPMTSTGVRERRGA